MVDFLDNIQSMTPDRSNTTNYLPKNKWEKSPQDHIKVNTYGTWDRETNIVEKDTTLGTMMKRHY